MSGGGETRVSIPDNVRSTIQNIREITKKQHGDDEIYAVLKECSMDPNETLQKLLYLDTFHEVKNRRDRKKENLKGREDSRTAPGTQRRMVRGGGQGHYSSDAGGGRNYSARRENGGSHISDGGSMSSSLPVQQKTKNNAASPITKAPTGIPNGLKNLPNGSSIHASSQKPTTAVDGNKLGATAPRYAVVVASTPVIGLKDQRKTTSISDHLPVSATAASDSNVCIAPDPSSCHIQENKIGSGDSVDFELSKNEEVASKSANHMNREITHNENAEADGKIRHTESPETPSSLTPDSSPDILPSISDGQSQLEPLVPLKVITPVVATVAVEATSQVLPEPSLTDAKHVTFPNHIKVPESLRSVLTFGSINATYGAGPDCGSGNDGNVGAVESSQDTEETADEPLPSNNTVSSSVQGDFPETLASPNELEKLQPLESNVSSTTDSDSKSELSKQDLQLPREGMVNPIALNGPVYNLGFLHPMLGSQVVQVEGHDNQAHEAPRSLNLGGNSVAVPSPNTTPPLPSSVAVSQQSIPVIRQAYPPNYYPYGPYIPPYYFSPMHQFVGPNGYPGQPAAYLPPVSPAAAGVKFTVPQFKAGSNGGNPTHYNIQSGGSFITTPVGYAPISAVTSGSSVGNNEEHGASQLKESHIYTTGQLTEGSTVWIHAPGQEFSSLYNLPQGQRLTFSHVHAAHAAMTGIYQPGQTMASPTFLQQSQAVSGTAENMGPPSAAYQQPQHTQMNWNSSF